MKRKKINLFRENAPIFFRKYVRKKIDTTNKKENKFIEVKKLRSLRVKSIKFYKPISKI